MVPRKVIHMRCLWPWRCPLLPSWAHGLSTTLLSSCSRFCFIELAMFLAILNLFMSKNPMVARILFVFLMVVPSSLFAESWDEERFVAQAKELNSKERLAAELDLERAEVSE